MTTDHAPEKWVYQQHTRVKHELLQQYLGGWLRILGQRNKKLFIMDGFAGRGEYAGGSPGSPIIILRKAKELISEHNVSQVICGFVEKDSENFANLRSVIDRIKPSDPSIAVLAPRNAEFEEVAGDAITWLQRSQIPSFWFIDPFGFTGMPFETIRSIMSLDRSEVFITLMTRDMNRFLTRINLEQVYDQLLASGEWREAIGSGTQSMSSERQLRDLYVHELRAIGCMVTAFRVSMDERRQTLYYMVHATKHPKGRWLMKDVMHGEGVNRLFEYLGPEDQIMRAQLPLIPVDNVPGLMAQLLTKFSGRAVTFDQLLVECCDDNELRVPDYRAALQNLRGEGRITVQPVTSKTDSGLNGRDRIRFPRG
jgi:three-Cys-motif partner protein